MDEMLPSAVLDRSHALRRQATMMKILYSVLIGYLICIAMVVFWPSPVDQKAGGLIQATLIWLHGQGFPHWFNYRLVEWLSNVAFFMPLGALALMVGFRLRTVLFGSFALSSCIELLQGTFLAQRTASVLDVLANTLGGGAGALTVLILAGLSSQMAAKRL